MRLITAIFAGLDTLAEYLAALFIVLVVGGFVFGALAGVSAETAPPAENDPGGYHPGTAEDIEADIDRFFNAGAIGYLIWQYSGDKHAALANDPWSFFRGTPEWDEVCAMLKAKSGGSQFVGVNMWDIGAHPGQAYDHFSYLRNSCGVSVVRVFAKAGGAAGMQQVLAAAQSANMQIIIAVGDFANGGGGIPWGHNELNHDLARKFFTGGYKGEYMDFAASIAPLSSHPAVKIIEIANEPHCFEFDDLVDPYINWARESAALFAGAGARDIGIGQIAYSGDGAAVSACDFRYFDKVNSTPGITAASGHHYNEDQAQDNLKMLAISPVPFYVGEANVEGPNKKQDVNPLATETPVDPDYYFLYPIKGLVDGKQEEFIQDLKDQGYEVNCTQMPISIVEGTEGFDDGSYLFDKIGNDTDKVRTNVEHIVDLVDARAPNWRSRFSSKNPFTSLEDHMAYQDTTISSSDGEADFKTNVTTAPYYRLTSIEQQCEDKKIMLEAIEQLCQEGTTSGGPGCAIDQPIPGTNGLTPLGIKGSVMGADCKKVAEAVASGNPPVAYQALMNVPMYLPNAYRLAFLVWSTELTGPEEKKEIPIGARFAFYRCHSSDCGRALEGDSDKHRQPPHEVRIFVFRLPDTVADNRNPESSYYYEDAAQRTRDAIQSIDQQERQDKVYDAVRDFWTISEYLDCAGSAYCNGNPLVQALVGFVNMRARMNAPEPLDVDDVAGRGGCTFRNFMTENSKEDPEFLYNSPVKLSDQGKVAGALQREPGKIGQYTDNIGYRDEGLRTPAFILEGQGDAENPSRSLPWTNGDEYRTKIKGWVIYPKRYQYDSVISALNSIMYTVAEKQEYDKYFSNNPQLYGPKYISQRARLFRLVDQFLKKKTKDIETHTVQHWLDEPEGKCHYVWMDRCNAFGCHKERVRVCPSETLHLAIHSGITADPTQNSGYNVRLWGGELGYVLRELQRAVRTETDAVHKYLQKCDAGMPILANPTEAFLTGTCADQVAKASEEWCTQNLPGLLNTPTQLSPLEAETGDGTSGPMAQCQAFLENGSEKEKKCFVDTLKECQQNNAGDCFNKSLTRCNNSDENPGAASPLCPYRGNYDVRIIDNVRPDDVTIGTIGINNMNLPTTTTILSEDESRKLLCDAAEFHGVPGFMLRGILAIEGSRYSNALLSGKEEGEVIPCQVSDTGDVGPFQIHVPSCVPQTNLGGDQTLNKDDVPTKDLCSFGTAVDIAAQILKSKANALDETYGITVPEKPKEWTYEMAYKIAGLYNGDSAENCARIGEKSQIRVDPDREYTYCRFAVEAFKSRWHCDHDPDF